MTNPPSKLFLRTLRISQSIASFILTVLFVLAIFLTVKDDSKWILKSNDQPAHKNSFPHCNLFEGKWVFDNKSYPLYNERSCSFLVGDFACEKSGRKDVNYQHWRWQPNDCDLPRFNATALLEKLRGKRAVFVGDSLNKNQWISMVCLLESSLHPAMKSVIWKGNLITFEAREYNATIDFYWSPMLLESNCDDPVNHRIIKRIVRINSIEKHARHWNNADILIFDSFMWWLQPETKLLWGSLGSPDGIYKRVGMELRVRSYEMALKTWTDWLDIHINRTKTKLFFMSLSPFHRKGEDWGMPVGENCYGETEPISAESYWGSGTDRRMMLVAEAAMRELKTRGVEIKYLNITQLSDYRKDAHPSIYKKHWVPPTAAQLENPKSYSDCVHWCLPGVPDVWNEILYAYLMHTDDETAPKID